MFDRWLTWGRFSLCSLAALISVSRNYSWILLHLLFGSDAKGGSPQYALFPDKLYFLAIQFLLTKRTSSCLLFISTFVLTFWDSLPELVVSHVRKKVVRAIKF